MDVDDDSDGYDEEAASDIDGGGNGNGNGIDYADDHSDDSNDEAEPPRPPRPPASPMPQASQQTLRASQMPRPEEMPQASQMRRLEGPDGMLSDDEDAAVVMDEHEHAEALAGANLDMQYDLLMRTFVDNGGNMVALLKQQFDFDMTLSHSHAIEGRDSGRRGYATQDEIIELIEKRMVSTFDLEAAMHRRTLDMDKAVQVFQNTCKVHDGAMAANFCLIRNIINSCTEMVKYAFNGRKILGGVAVDATLEHELRSYRIDRHKRTMNLRAVDFYLEQAFSRNLRKLVCDKAETQLYAPIVIDGHTTVSFRCIGTLKAWVGHYVRSDLYPDLFDAFVTKAAMLPQVTAFIEGTNDSRFPFYVVSEHIHGFANGYVDVLTSRAFFYKDSPPDMLSLVAKHHHKDVVLDRKWFSVGERCRTGCVVDADARQWVYTKQHFDGTTQQLRYDMPPWRKDGRVVPPPPLHVDMPAMQQILDFQGYTAAMQLFLYAMIGRTLLAVGTRDQFSTILLMSGETQSGKSTVLDHVKDSLFPNTERIAILSSNKEEKFGLQTAYNKVRCSRMLSRRQMAAGK